MPFATTIARRSRLARYARRRRALQRTVIAARPTWRRIGAFRAYVPRAAVIRSRLTGMRRRGWFRRRR